MGCSPCCCRLLLSYSVIHPWKIDRNQLQCTQEKGQTCAPRPRHKVKIWPKINIFFMINHAGCVKQLCLQGELLCKSGKIWERCIYIGYKKCNWTDGVIWFYRCCLILEKGILTDKSWQCVVSFIVGALHSGWKPCKVEWSCFHAKSLYYRSFT